MIKTVLFKPQQWMGFVRVFLTVKKPLRFLILYLSLSDKHMKSSDFEIHYRFKGKNQKLELRSVHDYCTFFEVYCRRDYWAGTPDMVVVDIGSNIGITARFFLNNGTKFIYLYEPDPTNLVLLKRNLKDYVEKFHLSEIAVSVSSGSEFFEFEKTGRYGKIFHSSTPEMLQIGKLSKVEVTGIEEVLSEVFQKFSQISLLKIDIEGLELSVLKAIPLRHLAKIGKIQYETWPNGVIEYPTFR
jgi:FkbM family methyltransferase